jgi:hypothetical protein
MVGERVSRFCLVANALARRVDPRRQRRLMIDQIVPSPLIISKRSATTVLLRLER